MLPAFALLIALGIGPLPQAPPDAVAPTTLDVVITDRRGVAIDTLTTEDFTVVDQGVPVPVESVRFVRAPGGELVPARAAAPGVGLRDESVLPEGSRLFGILLDEYHVRPGESADRVREALIRLVREDLRPNDRIALVKPLDSLAAISLTSDREAVAGAIGQFDPRRGDYRPRSAFERDLIGTSPSNADASRAQITSASLTALAMYLGRFASARKTLLFVSEGFAPRGPRRGEPSPPAFSAAAAIANRHHVAIYTVNPSEADPDDSADAAHRDAEAMRRLASETNGRATMSAGGVVEVLKSAVADSAGYYLLTVLAPRRPADARWRGVEVTVRRQDLLVRARTGYWAPGEPRPRSESPGSTPLSIAWGPPRRSSPLIRPWFGLSRGATNQTRVSFVWEPAGLRPGDRSTGAVPARVVMSVTTLQGEPVFEGVVWPANTLSARQGGDRRSLASFEAPSGRLLVQMTVEDAASREIDRDVRDLVVGGFPGPVSLGTAEVLRVRTEREYRGLAADPDATPSAGRQFSRAERVIARVPVFATGSPVEVSARLVSGLGGLMRTLQVALLPARPSVYQIDVPLASLAAGEYWVEFVARTPEGEARDRLVIRVTP